MRVFHAYNPTTEGNHYALAPHSLYDRCISHAVGNAGHMTSLDGPLVTLRHTQENRKRDTL